MTEEYDDKHWEELIKTIIERIGIGQFVLVSMAILSQLGHAELMQQIIIEQAETLDKLTKALKGANDEHKNIPLP